MTSLSMASHHNVTGVAAATGATVEQHHHMQQTPKHQQSSWWHPTTTSHRTATRTQPTIDPPEDITTIDDRYYYDDSSILASHSQHRHSSNDNYDVNAIVSSLSLRTPDPPGFNYSSLGKRKYNNHCKNYDEEGGDTSQAMPASVTKKSKVAADPPLQVPHTLSNTLASTSSSSTLGLTTITGAVMQQIAPKSGDAPSSSIDNDDTFIETDEVEEADNEIMSVDDSSSCNSSDNNNTNVREDDQSDDNSSIVSESSIRNAMYQLVFGRLSMHSTIGGGVGGGGSTIGGSSKYDAVDSKIEDLIRRSRLEATIEGRREKERNNRSDRCVVGTRYNTMSSSDMDMDDGDEDADSDTNKMGAVDDDWTPGHG